MVEYQFFAMPKVSHRRETIPRLLNRYDLTSGTLLFPVIDDA
jgi:hypothetical protein